MATLPPPVAGCKPAGPAPATPPAEHIPGGGWRRDPSPEDIRRAEQHRNCPHNVRFFVLAQIIELARQAADDSLEAWEDECECGHCDTHDHFHLATATELNNHFAGSAIEGSLLPPDDFDTRKLSNMELGDRLESLSRYVRGLRDGNYEDPTEADVEVEDPIISQPR